ncbi:MAG: hypothetical protein PVF43_02615 [Candidatus Eiseniibacteriota bacterium]|jgi:hypothetical protein
MMRTHLLPVLASVLLLLATGLASATPDGTREGAIPSIVTQTGHGPLFQTFDMVVLNPIESVSINASQTWQDNRLRAYWSSSLLNVNGFLLFDVTSVPDGAVITDMRLLCYLENAFGSPSSNPVVDLYYSADDGWTRASVTPGSLSLDVLLVDDVPFGGYTPTYEFVLDVSAHDWSGDLADNQICIGFSNDVNYYSYVYFFGAGGSPAGAPPELTITYETATPVEATTWGAVKSLFE